ncbi:MAG: O-methyltransferase [Mycoplasma sp.]
MNNILNNKKIKDIYEKSVIDNIPILRDETVLLILKFIRDNNIKSILEIGTAYGYSSSIFSLIEGCNVTTIERDKERFNIASNFLKSNPLVNVVNIDCFEYTTDEKFDLILIDGPKKKQIDLIKQFEKNLNNSGTIIIDNIYLKKFLEKETLSTSQKNILEDLKKLREFILENDKYNTTIFDIDDGVAIMEAK